MPAERCGTSLTYEVVEQATRKLVERNGRLQQLVVSIRAYRLLQKITRKFPDFIPSTESDIWIKAYKMGITEDE